MRLLSICPSDQPAARYKMTSNAEKASLLQGLKDAAKTQPWIVAIWRVFRPPVDEVAVEPPADRDLQEISELSLPVNTAFFQAREAAHAIEGMFSDFSMAIIDSLLSFQKAAGIGGDMLEFGILQGRSAALLGRQLAGSERLVLVDVFAQLNPDAIAPFAGSVDFILCSTETVEKDHPQYCAPPRAYRFIHIDASHAYRATFTELQLADKLLAPGGIISLDDFTNLNYSQNIAAIFRYLYTAPTDLTVFLVTDEKAYLCRKNDLTLYTSFVLDRLIAEMGSRDIPECVLARTDIDPDYRAFYARNRSSGEEGHFYGLGIYANYYRQP
jgi:predicted O-methyltransferase YrrM